MLAATGAAAVLGACGSSAPSPTFSRDFRAQESELTQLSRELAGVIQRASRQTDLQLARALRPLANRSDDIVRRLETLQPPADLLTDYTALRSALNRRVTDLRAIVSGLKAHNAALARTSTQALLVDSAAATAALQRIDARLG